MQFQLSSADMNDNGATLEVLSCCGETVHPVYADDFEHCDKCNFCTMCTEFYPKSEVDLHTHMEYMEEEDYDSTYTPLTELHALRVQNCSICEEATVIMLTFEQVEQYMDWKRSGFVAPIQNALTTFSKGERERIISGTHDECWTRI